MAFVQYWPLVWSDLRAAVANVWPEIGAQFRAVQVQRINWDNEISDGALPLPYVVIQMPAPVENTLYGMGNIVYTVMPTFFYLAQQLGPDRSATLESRLKAMQDYLRDTRTLFSAVQVQDEGFMLDVSETNPINASMLGAVQPIFAGSIGFRALIGDNQF